MFRQDPNGCGRQLNIPEVPVSFLEVQISRQPIGKNGTHDMIMQRIIVCGRIRVAWEEPRRKRSGIKGCWDKESWWEGQKKDPPEFKMFRYRE